MADAKLYCMIGDAGIHIVRGYAPSFKTQSANDLNGRKAQDPAEDRSLAWFLVTDIPPAVAQKALYNLKSGTFLISVPPDAILDNLGGGNYRLSENISATPELKRRYGLSEAKLLTEFPGASDLIADLFDKTKIHPLVLGEIPSVSWNAGAFDGLRACFFDLWSETLAEPGELEE